MSSNQNHNSNTCPVLLDFNTILHVRINNNRNNNNRIYNFRPEQIILSHCTQAYAR